MKKYFNIILRISPEIIVKTTYTFLRCCIFLKRDSQKHCFKRMLEIRHSNWAWTMDMQVLGPGVCLSTPGVCGPALPPRLTCIYSIHHCGHCFKKNYWRKSSIHSSSYVYNQTIIQTTKIRNLRRIYFFRFFR